MPRPAVFFDRDNTLIANSEYLGDPEQVVLLPGAADAVARVRKLGFATIVVSNQSGVARGLFTEDDVRAVNARVDRALLEVHPDALIEQHEYSPHHPDATVDEYRGDHRRRKPQPGMLLDAAESYDLDLNRSWLIGDAPRDVEAGHRAGCRTILVREPLDSVSPAASEPMRIEPDYIATSLEDAVDFIEMHHDDSNDEDDVPMPRNGTIDDALDAAAHGEPLIATMEPPPDATDDPINLGPHVVSTTTSGPAPVSSHLGLMKAAITSTAPPAGAEKQTVLLLERVVEELRRGNDPPQDFSVAKMLAGIVQGFAIAALFAALLFRDSGGTTFTTLMMVAIFLQVMVSSLVLMGR
jgi:D-glycero-D-manno-heptose 1,7-bisphosphate phosphatase